MAVTRRLIEGVLSASDNCPKEITQLFKGKGMDQARGALRRGNVHRTFGVDVIRAYLGISIRLADYRGRNSGCSNAWIFTALISIQNFWFLLGNPAQQIRGTIAATRCILTP